jgi:hypothetical protein
MSNRASEFGVLHYAPLLEQIDRDALRRLDKELDLPYPSEKRDLMHAVTCELILIALTEHLGIREDTFGQLAAIWNENFAGLHTKISKTRGKLNVSLVENIKDIVLNPYHKDVFETLALSIRRENGLAYYRPPTEDPVIMPTSDIEWTSERRVFYEPYVSDRLSWR